LNHLNLWQLPASVNAARNSKQLFGGVYANRRVFITGASGFKGSWLAEWLVQLGANVTGYSLYFPSTPCHFKKIHLDERIHHVKGDVRKLGSLRRTIDEAEPEIVFHLAAQPIVRVSYDDPIETFQTNLLGTVNVLEALRHRRSIRAGVIVTSDKCYENIEQLSGYVESDRLGGKDPYSASKACAEIAFSAYARSFFGAPANSVGHATNRNSGKQGATALIASARAGNVIGGGDWAKDRIVPDCVRAWTAGRAPVIRNPVSTRPWQHVLEPLSGYLWLGARLLSGDARAHGEAFNFGPSPKVNEPVESLIGDLRKFWPEAVAPEIRVDPHAKAEAGLLRLDCKKASKVLSWKATLSFSETAEFTAYWYKNYLAAPSSALDLTHEQISAYCQLASKRGSAWAPR
jgi:CDP-glucose 4,6-dehydratase